MISGRLKSMFGSGLGVLLAGLSMVAVHAHTDWAIATADGQDVSVVLDARNVSEAQRNALAFCRQEQKSPDQYRVLQSGVGPTSVAIAEGGGNYEVVSGQATTAEYSAKAACETRSSTCRVKVWQDRGSRVTSSREVK
jgi:hypothetical protein